MKSMERFVKHKILSAIPPLVVILTLSYFIIFQNLGKFQIRMWDEATYANNSLDMLLSSKNIFLVEHLGKPDLYNTKPPLVIWLQALSMKALGINEFAIRLPSALAGLLTVLLVYFFCIRVLKSKTIGFIAASILLTVKGFISNHMVRTGDLDAVLLFWLTLGLFAFIDMLINKPKNQGFHFLILTISFTCGFLTKGIAGFFFIPFMFIISLLFNNHTIFREKSMYLGALATLLLCTSYYLIREFLTPGYLELVLESEIFRFNQVVMSWHVHPFDYYYQNLKSSRFSPFFYILPVTLLNFFILKSHQLKTVIYLMIVAIGYFLLISYPAVKLEWYDAPLFPILSILIGLSFVETGIFILNKLRIAGNLVTVKITLAVTAMLLLIVPLKAIFEQVKYPEEQLYSMEFDGAYLKHLKQYRPEIKNLTVFKKEDHEEHYDQLLFYMRAYKHQYEYDVRLTQDLHFETGEMVMVCKQNDKEQIQKKYVVQQIDTWRNGTLFLIINKVSVIAS